MFERQAMQKNCGIRTSMSKKIENAYPSDRNQRTCSALESNEIPFSQQESTYSKAAGIIQRAWRKHVDIAVFKHLKKLVSFHNQGDPRLFLRFINPMEAKILDAASGALIRFRLGGVTYPPNIYYKIYTRAPIVDMCANSPKDYTHTQQKKLVPMHNGPMIYDDHFGWYQRVENNGWRILSGKMSVFEDPITLETNGKKTEFHYCRMNRQQDVARKRKIRKIDWMRKMYAEGLQAGTQYSDTTLLLQKSTQRINSLEHNEPDLVSEQEVDDLLAWTNSLDFDESSKQIRYISEWKDLGTSSCCILNKD
ncbi:protein MFI isoform X1 [Misgurnus anguillicaudatus]|uniref:protein MFI isoform X1 n=2 Tax=Misgurnus anguillicaudatus TaxID=75329 RepID=UPI003CCF02B4